MLTFYWSTHVYFGKGSVEKRPGVRSSQAMLLVALCSLLLALAAASKPCCTTDACSRGLDILQLKTALTLGIGRDDYIFTTPAANGAVSGGRLFCTSQNNCYLQSNRLFPVPCKDQLQLQAKMNFQEYRISGNITSSLGALQDPFYGFGSLGFVDPVEGFVFEYRITPGMIYAVYGRVPSKETDCSSFLYLIPVKLNENAPCDNYEIVLEKCTGMISYRLDQVEVLRLHIGEAIDPKFQVQGFSTECTGGCDCAGMFPEAVHVRLGNAAMEYVDCCSAATKPACQVGVFNECFDPLSNACRVNCTYSDTQQPLSTFNMGLASLYKQLSVLQTKEAVTCEDACSSDTDPVSETDPSCAQQGRCRAERRQRVIDNQQRRLNE